MSSCPPARITVSRFSAIAVLLAIFSATAAHAQTQPGNPDALPSGAARTADNKGPAANPVRPGIAKPSTSAASAPAKPLWSELGVAQRQALSPLVSEWDKLDATQKQKWLVISEKYSTLQPDQQIRLQERMRDWVKLTPEQRRAARENYSKAKKLDPSRKSAEWEQYQQLPEETKRKLAAEAAAKNRVANLPPPTENKNRITPPKKTRPEKPQAAQPPVPAASAPSSTPVPPPADNSTSVQTK